MKLLICGSRGWHDADAIDAIVAGYDVLADGRGERLTVIHGHCPTGADALADSVARQWGAEVIREPADWDRFGKLAGPLRNQKMIDDHKPDVVYAFRSSGKSNGTDDMVSRARNAGIPTYVVTEES